MSSVNIFNTGKSGLFASRAALSTTGHNIANVNTEGYSRQRVEQSTQTPHQKGNLVFGSGTKLKQIHRINDEYLTKQINGEVKYLGKYEEKDLALTQAENIFSEVTNVGMNRLITKFFNEFRKLGNEPESEALRAVVKESADQVVGDFKRLSRSIRDIQKNLDVRIEANVRQVNELAQRVAHLNEQIKNLEIQGGEAADLRDSRDLAVKELSKMADLSVSTNEKGDLIIALTNGGCPIVTGRQYSALTVESSKADPESGKPEGGLEIHMKGLAQTNITDRFQEGKLGGLIEARDKVLGSSLSHVDELAYAFATKLNEIHRQGFSINGTGGVNFFKQPIKKEQAAELLELSEFIKADERNIATALTPNSPGDNRLVQLISRLQHSRVMGDGNATFDDFYNGTVAELATVSQKNKQLFEHQNNILTQLDKIRESVSGVSLDEETTNLVQFQHAFDASAKVIKVADEMLETVLNIKR